MAKRPRWRRVPWLIRYSWGARIASRMRVWLIRATHLHCHVEFQGPVRLGPGFQLNIAENGTFIVGHGVDFRRGFVCEIGGDGRVVIGDGTIFTSNALVQCSTSIEIGRRCVFGQSVLIQDGQHRYDSTDTHWLEQGHNYRPLTIGDGAGASDKCTIQADLGEGCVVASGSVVTRPLPANCIAAGSPARVVRVVGPTSTDSAGETA
jgi:acetyltransferase-like isoleucine patch superfamily enzyme